MIRHVQAGRLQDHLDHFLHDVHRHRVAKHGTKLCIALTSTAHVRREALQRAVGGLG